MVKVKYFSLTKKPMAESDYIQAIHKASSVLNEELEKTDLGIEISGLLPYYEDEDLENQVEFMDGVIARACKKFVTKFDSMTKEGDR